MCTAKISAYDTIEVVTYNVVRSKQQRGTKSGITGFEQHDKEKRFSWVYYHGYHKLLLVLIKYA